MKPIFPIILGCSGLLVAAALAWFAVQAYSLSRSVEAHSNYLEEELINLRTEMDELGIAQNNLIRRLEAGTSQPAQSRTQGSTTSSFGGFSVDRDGSGIITPRREPGQPLIGDLDGTDNSKCTKALRLLGSPRSTPEQWERARQDRDRHCK